MQLQATERRRENSGNAVVAVLLTAPNVMETWARAQDVAVNGARVCVGGKYSQFWRESLLRNLVRGFTLGNKHLGLHDTVAGKWGGDSVLRVYFYRINKMFRQGLVTKRKEKACN